MNPGFQNNPPFTGLEPEGCGRFLLDEQLTYVTESGAVITVPAGFITDWASIPRPLWPLASPETDGRLSGTLHDYLYSLRGGAPYMFNRARCDATFHEALIHEGEPHWKAELMYLAVRSFGWLYSFNPGWNKTMMKLTWKALH